MSWNWKLKMYNPEGNPPGGMCSFLLWYIKSDFSLVMSWGEMLRDFEFQLMTWFMSPAPKNNQNSPKPCSPSKLWLKLLPKLKVCKDCGSTTPLTLWLNSSPKLKCWRALGNSTPSKLWLKLWPKFSVWRFCGNMKAFKDSLNSSLKSRNWRCDKHS